MGSDKKYMPTRELQVQRSYWAQRENVAKMKKQAYEKFLRERGASYGVGVGLDASGRQIECRHVWGPSATSGLKLCIVCQLIMPDETVTRTGPAPDFVACPPDDHLWIGHFDLEGMTHRMCLNCGVEEKAVVEAKAMVSAFRERHPGIPEFWSLHGDEDWIAPAPKHGQVHDYRDGGLVTPRGRNTIMGKPAGDISPVDELARVAGLSLREPPKPVKSTGDAFFGRHTIYGVNEGDYNTPYMTRYWIGRLRLHIFHRGDNDADPHDHPWNFWTFPLTSYVEEVTEPAFSCGICSSPVPVTHREYGDYCMRHGEAVTYDTRRQVVRAFRLHYRPATHTHRVLGRYAGWDKDFSGCMPSIDIAPGKIVTIVWRGNGGRKWGFLRKDAEGKRCWIPWRTYVYEGGKHAPCE